MKEQLLLGSFPHGQGQLLTEHHTSWSVACIGRAWLMVVYGWRGFIDDLDLWPAGYLAVQCDYQLGGLSIVILLMIGISRAFADSMAHRPSAIVAGITSNFWIVVVGSRSGLRL